jgi:hypothetical protein
MAFGHGSKAKLYLAGSDVSSAFNSVSVSRSRDTAETSGLGASAKAYITGLADATVSAEGMFEADSTLSDDTIATMLASADKSAFILAPQGDTAAGDPALVGKIDDTNYEITSPVDGVTATTLEFQTSDGAVSGKILANKAARSSTANGTAVDGGASSANGLVAVLQVFAISGSTPSLTVAIQHSADGVTYVTLGTFTAVTSGTSAQTIVTSSTVNRYVRATWTITGSTPSATFAVAFGRK